MKDPTMTHVIEDLIDSLKIPDVDKNSTASQPVKPAV
jgi:hypothetical protein